jgi:hypothetical protein
MPPINLRISSGTLGLPPRRFDFQRQNDRNPARCQRTTVSGRTMHSACKIPGARRYNNPTNTNRSKARSTNLFGDLRRSTLICYRRTRISASSRALEQNKLVRAVHSNMRTSTIGHEHHPIPPASQPYRVSDKDTAHHTHRDTCPSSGSDHQWESFSLGVTRRKHPILFLRPTAIAGRTPYAEARSQRYASGPLC